jgi:hypothetical protein
MSTSFAPEKIEQLKEFYIENHSSQNRMDCITTLNHAMNILYGETLKLGSQIDTTMNKLDKLGKVESNAIIEYRDESGEITKGSKKPHTLSESISNKLVILSGVGQGWFAFGLSIMDGYHSVLLLLNKQSSELEIYWCDQTMGCRKMEYEELDKTATDKTVVWWSKNNEFGKQFKTKSTLWLLKN